MLKIELKEDNTFSYSINGDDDTLIKEAVEIVGLTAALLVRSGARYAKATEAQRRLTIERILDGIALDAANVANHALNNGEFDRKTDEAATDINVGGSEQDEGQAPEA